MQGLFLNVNMMIISELLKALDVVCFYTEVYAEVYAEVCVTSWC